MGRFLYYFRPK